MAEAPAKMKVTFRVETTLWEWLQAKTTQYKIDSVDKAMRILCNYARDEGMEAIFSNSPGKWKKGSQVTVEFYSHQLQNIGSVIGKYEINSLEEALHRLMLHTKDKATEEEVFVKVRCNDPVCTHTH